MMKNKRFTPLEIFRKTSLIMVQMVKKLILLVKKCCVALTASKSSLTGFTLIELMLVVIIIGTLAALVITRLAGRAEQARITAVKADILSNIPLALDLYELDNGVFPSTQQGLDALIEKPNTQPLAKNWNGPYLKKRPIDPWGNQYRYTSPGMHNTQGYDLFSVGKDGTEGGGDDIGNWEQ
jgi:general secretion pathway protein G